MKVVLIGAYPPPHGGLQTHLVALRNYLRTRQIPCSVINITRFREARAEQLYHPQHAVELATLLVRLPGDILHLHLGGNLTRRLLWLGLLCCLLPRRRAVLTLHSGGYPSSPDGQSAHPWTFTAFVLRQFDRLIGVNRELVELFHRLGVPAEKTRLIVPYVLPGDRQSATTSAVALPRALQRFFESHRPILTTVGLLEPEYDLDLQVDVLGRVLERLPGAGLLIIGAGSLESTLRRTVATKAYADHVLVAGDVPHEGTLKAIAMSDVFLRTTRYDGDSIAVREALQVGTPVIATDNRMRPAGVRLIPPGDIDALFCAIDAVLNEDRPRSPVADVSTEHNLQAVLDVYLELAR
jgi:glycogen(starch) synthase